VAGHRGSEIAALPGIVLAAALLAGCTLNRLPAAPPTADPVPMHGDRVALWKVGAVEPVLTKADAFTEFRAAQTLVYTLRRIDLFHEVDFARRMRCPIDVEVVALPRVDDVQSEPFWFSLLTLSIKMDERISIPFHPAAAPDERIELTYDTGLWWGLAPLVLSPLAAFGALGDWTLLDTDDLEIRQLRAQLIAKGGVLERHVGQQTPGHCPETP